MFPSPFLPQPNPKGDQSPLVDALTSINNFLPNQGLNFQTLGQQAFQTGEAGLAEGMAAYGPALSYYSKILSGSPGEMESAVAPEKASILDQYRAARKKRANLAPRSGGTNEATAQADYDQAGQVAALLQKLRPQAAQGTMEAAAGIGDIATKQAQLGLAESGQGQADIFNTIQALLAQRGQNVSTDMANMANLTSGLETVFAGLI